MKLYTLIVTVAIIASCLAETPAVVASLDESSKDVSLTFDANDVPTITVPISTEEVTIKWNDVESGSICNYPVSGSHFAASQGGQSLITNFVSIKALMNDCKFQKQAAGNGKKRGFIEAPTDSPDYEIWSNSMTITRTYTDNVVSTTEALPIQIWFPTRVVVSSDVTVGNNDFQVKASVNTITYDRDDAKWMVEIKMSTASPYILNFKTDPTANIVLSGRTVQWYDKDSAVAEKATLVNEPIANAEDDAVQTLKFSISGCQSFELSDALLFTAVAVCRDSDPNKCTASSDPTEIPINIDIATADACPVTKAFEFVPSVNTFIGSGETKTQRSLFTSDETVTFELKLTPPQGMDAPTITPTSVCIVPKTEKRDTCTRTVATTVVSPGQDGTSFTAAIQVKDIIVDDEITVYKDYTVEFAFSINWMTEAALPGPDENAVNGKRLAGQKESTKAKRKVMMASASSSFIVIPSKEKSEVNTSSSSVLSIVPGFLLTVFALAA